MGEVEKMVKGRKEEKRRKNNLKEQRKKNYPILQRETIIDLEHIVSSRWLLPPPEMENKLQSQA